MSTHNLLTQQLMSPDRLDPVLQRGQPGPENDGQILSTSQSSTAGGMLTPLPPDSSHFEPVHPAPASESSIRETAIGCPLAQEYTATVNEGSHPPSVQPSLGDPKTSIKHGLDFYNIQHFAGQQTHPFCYSIPYQTDLEEVYDCPSAQATEGSEVALEDFEHAGSNDPSDANLHLATDGEDFRLPSSIPFQMHDLAGFGMLFDDEQLKHRKSLVLE